jgi:Flp pilus assembly protein TadD
MKPTVFTGPVPLHKTGWGVIAVLVFFCFTACTPVMDPYHQKIAKLTVLENGEINSADEHIADLPAEELTEKANAYLQQGNLELARLHFSAALQKQPEAIPPLAGMGQVFYLRGNTARAGDIFETVLEKAPQNKRAMLGLARIARSHGNYASAEALFENLFATYPEDANIISELAVTYDSIGQDKLAEAEPLHRKVLDMEPDKPAGYNNLGFNYLLQGRYSEAIPLFSQALAIDPGNVRSKNNLATAFLLNNEETRALQLFEGTLGKPAAYNNIGYLYMTQGNWDKAEKCFRKALELNPVFYLRAQQNLERLNSLRSQSSD